MSSPKSSLRSVSSKSSLDSESESKYQIEGWKGCFIDFLVIIMYIYVPECVPRQLFIIQE